MAVALDMRELTLDETDEVSGGPIWIPILLGAGAVYLAANFAAGVIDGYRGKESQVED